MNKLTFKKLRSEFRKANNDAYFESHDGESFGKAVDKRLSKVTHPQFDVALFEKCSKPVVRDLVVSMPVFRALGYPFKKFEAILYG